jgi:hypothetical protein
MFCFEEWRRGEERKKIKKRMVKFYYSDNKEKHLEFL